MKRLILLILMITMYGSVVMAAGPRFIAGGTAYLTEDAPILSVRYGLSQEVSFLSNEQSATYMVTVAKRGDGGYLKGGDQEFAFFPVRPTGKGFRIFFLLGGDMTTLEKPEGSVTYLQASTGIGGYLDITKSTAIAIVIKSKSSEKEQANTVGIFLTSNIF